MDQRSMHELRRPAGRAWRVGLTMAFIVVFETAICGLAAAPVVLFWTSMPAWAPSGPASRALLLGLLAIPSYVAFALCLMPVSAIAVRVARIRTPPDAVMRITDAGWPLMIWACYMASSHVVRVLAGTLFRGTPVWSAYIRLNGSSLGRRVFVNTLNVSDHNLLVIEDDVVIGADAHVSGHTVEGGMVKTGRVRLARNVTIGLGSVIGIGVEAGEGSQVGALSLVPKHSRLEAGAVYAGIPVVRIDRPGAEPLSSQPPVERTRL